MFANLQIYDARERWLVGLADLGLAPLKLGRLLARPVRAPIRRILLLRLERIGDLLMVLDAIRTAREVWPEADIDLAVGSWNSALAGLVPWVSRVRVADVPWLARGEAGVSWPALLKTAQEWRSAHYDLVINFEPDIRSNLLAWLTGAPRRFGYRTAGGGALLTDADAYEPRSHVSVNAVGLIARAAGVALPAGATPGRPAPLAVPPGAEHAVEHLFESRRRPFIGVHASGGRPSKQWHLDRFADTARALAARHRATIVLTGSASDRAIVDEVRRRLDGIDVVDATAVTGLPELAALLARLDLLVTGDTGPMHLAAVMGTPIVALFGPSDPRRYGPLAAHQRILRVDLPCSPCGRVRLPPERCRGHVPECLDSISVDTVVAAATDLLQSADTRQTRAAG